MSNALTRLAKTIEERRDANPSKSWTAKLLSRGPEKCAQKFGEEAVETIIEAAQGNKKKLVEESADMLYHFLVMLASRDVSYDDVLKELESREGKSGIYEKASRRA